MREDLDRNQVRRLAPGDQFAFACQPGVACFNDCCRDLELALTPFDVARLRTRLGLSASEFLDRYCLIEAEEESPFPRVYLGMIDDGRASCPFVTSAGCRVYADRPGACRMYPLGRAAFTTGAGAVSAFHVLLSEPHCLGFAALITQDAERWTAAQGLLDYNRANDLLLPILHHPDLKQRPLSMAQGQMFVDTLYRLDEFRRQVLRPDFRSHTRPTAEEEPVLATDDIALLRFAGRWLCHELFNQ